MGSETFFTSWASVASVVVTGVLAYAGLVVLLRLSGKRTLAQLNAFDWAVTVAFGSTLASTLVSEDVALADGLAAFATLVALQFVVTSASTRIRTVERLVKNEPALLVRHGEILRKAAQRERISEEEIVQAVRSTGAASVGDVAAVVLETNGELSVLRDSAPSLALASRD